MSLKSCAILSAIALSLLITCAPPDSPMNNPSRAHIDGIHSLLSLGSEVPYQTAYPCTVKVKNSQFLDSFYVQSTYDNTTTMLASGTVGGDSIITFAFAPQQVGEYELLVYVTRTDDTRDTITVVVEAFDPSPWIQPQQMRYTVHLKDSVTLQFTLHDRTGDLKFAMLWQDSVKQDPDVMKTLVSDSQAIVTQKVAYPSLDTAVWLIQAVDNALHASAVISCTVYVSDTLPPVISQAHLKPSFGDTLVNVLPCTLTVRVTDDSPIDSVKFGGNTLSRIGAGDTFRLVTSALDSGKFTYMLRAWDRAGNSDSQAMSITYTGAKKYPPALTVKLAGQTVRENVAFKAIHLDSCVTIDPLSPYSIDSLVWTITEEDTAGRLHLAYNQSAKTVTITPPDSEWFGSEIMVFRVTAPGANGYAERILTFTVDSINDPPVITYKGQSKWSGTTFDTVWLDTLGHDPDCDSSKLVWSFTAGKKYMASIVAYKKCTGGIGGLCLYIPTRTVAFIPKIGGPDTLSWIGSDTLIFTVTDPAGASVSKPVILTKSIIHIITRPPVFQPPFGKRREE